MSISHASHPADGEAEFVFLGGLRLRTTVGGRIR